MKFRFTFTLIFSLVYLSSYSQSILPITLLDPQDQYKELYKEVELSQVFPDSKTFADAVPKFPASQIIAEYQKQKSQPGFSLNQFVKDHFIIPLNFSSGYKTNPNASASQHITDLWSILTHPADKVTEGENIGTLIPLPKSYIVPGGRFREIYYWDSYFSCLGLEQDHRIDLIENMIYNFGHLINTIGHIPNGNRTYYLGRSQPPFFGSMVGLLSDIQGQQVLVNYLPEMEKEYHYWMTGKEKLMVNSRINQKSAKVKASHTLKAQLKVVEVAPGIFLNRYCDELLTPRGESYREDYLAVHSSIKNPISQEMAYQNIRSAAESGWDFSSRWFNGQKDIAHLNTTDLIPVDLNCILYNLEEKLSRAYYLDNDSLKGNDYMVLAQNRKKAILHYLWNDKEGFFLDFNYKSQKPSPIKTLAGLFPLYFDLASPKMALRISEHIKRDFLKPGGLTTTLNYTGQQWDAPNGWAPLQYIGIQGFRHYHMDSLAETIAQRWMRLNEKVFKATGKMQEKYNVVDTSLVGGGGEYPNQDGFGWTNGVYRKLESLYNH